MTDRKPPNQAAGLIVSSVKQLISMLPARKQQEDDNDERGMGVRARWDTRHVHEIDGQMADTIERHREGRFAVMIRPPEENKENPGKATKRIFQAVYGEFPRLSVEITEIEDQIVYRIICFSEQEANQVVNRVMSLSKCDAEIRERPPLPGEKGEFAAISKIGYEHDNLLPVAHDKSSEREEPYRALIDTLSGEWDGQTTIQMIVEPTNDWTTRWTRGCPIESGKNRLLYSTPFRHKRMPSMVLSAVLSAAIAAGWLLDRGPLTEIGLSSDLIVSAGRMTLFSIAILTVVGLWFAAILGFGYSIFRVTAKRVAKWQREKPWTNNKPTKTERADVDPIASQSESPGYRVSMRVMTTAENPMKAAGYHDRIVRTLRNEWHNRATGQQFVGKTVGEFRERPFRKMVNKIASRRPDRNRLLRFTDKIFLRPIRRFPMYMSDFELSSTVRYPDRSVGGASVIQFATMETTDPSAKADNFGGKSDSEPDAEPAKNVREEPAVDEVESTSTENETETEIEAEPIEEVINDDR